MQTVLPDARCSILIDAKETRIYVIDADGQSNCRRSNPTQFQIIATNSEIKLFALYFGGWNEAKPHHQREDWEWNENAFLGILLIRPDLIWVIMHVWVFRLFIYLYICIYNFFKFIFISINFSLFCWFYTFFVYIKLNKVYIKCIIIVFI